MLDKYIERALEEHCIISVPIQKLTQDELIKLSEKAREKEVLVTLRAEHSNAHQGVLISLVRKDIAKKFIKWL